MLHILSFSKVVNGVRFPLTNEDGVEITMEVEADTKTSAIYATEVKKFCQENGCTVRRVN